MTLRNYRIMILQMIDSARPICGVAEFLSGPKEQGLILRHDVDRRPSKSLQIAEIEHELGIRSTFYFRVSREGKFAEQIVRSISRLGHEIGYHYETLSDCNGDLSTALQLFEANLHRLRMVCDCRTVSMHGRPLSRHDNGHLLKSVVLADYELDGDATLSMLQYGCSYFTDVGGRWNHPSANLRDFVGHTPKTTGDLNEPRILSKILAEPIPIYISTHPERWSEGAFDALYCRGFDLAANTAKKLLGVRSRTRPDTPRVQTPIR